MFDWGSRFPTPQDPLYLPLRHTTIRRYDDSSNGGIDDDGTVAVRPTSCTSSAGALLRVRSRAAVAAVVKWCGSVVL